jgi:hypothetical protein
LKTAAKQPVFTIRAVAWPPAEIAAHQRQWDRVAAETGLTGRRGAPPQVSSRTAVDDVHAQFALKPQMGYGDFAVVQVYQCPAVCALPGIPARRRANCVLRHDSMPEKHCSSEPDRIGAGFHLGFDVAPAR